MGTISTAFGLISGALDADQAALNVVANNVANANTTGYTEETPDWQENAPITVDGMTMGQGVTETGATSQRDLVLNERLDQQQQLASASGTRLAALNQMQALFTPDSGSSSSTAGDIGSDITNFFDSFSSLESDPTDNALRESVLTAASTLSGDISSAAASLNSQSAAIDQDASGIAGQVNSLTSALAQVNQQIESTSPNDDAGTLEDQRQQDLSQLSQLIGINQISTSNNGLEITTTSGQLLVSGSQSYQLTTGTVNGVTDFFLGGSDITPGLTTGGGQLGGYLTARDQDIPNALGSLDQLAYSISTSVNAANNSGTDLDGIEGTGTNSAGVTGTGATPLYIFNQPAQVAGSAAAMAVTMTDPNQIAAAGLGDGTGDDSNAITMASLASGAIVSGQTPTDYYSNFVTTLGSTVSEVQTENTAQNASVTQLQTQNNAISSVNLNDEAAAMSTLESSYQAASQVFNILNTVMTSALNLGVQTAVS
ncbi:MAG: flagellar hook-associated protein FlgK [Terracidiphilus sp.]|jgi:flagellar hook-associated protein 1 FlgK